MKNEPKRSQDDTERACIECEAIWVGDLECPYCGAPGEPLVETNDNVEKEEPCTTLWN